MIRSYATVSDRQTVALQAIAWIVSDSGRAERFLALTGLDPDQLREGLMHAPVQSAALDHLLAHEPDLVAFAAESGLSPAAIAQAARA